MVEVSLVSSRRHARLLGGVFALSLIACGGDSPGGGAGSAAGAGGGNPQDSGVVDGSFIDTTLSCGNGKLDSGEACDDGNAATGHDARLKEFHVSAVTGGRDALG